jgi:hypothetical protein
MQLHVTSSFYQLTQNCTGVFNAAAEGKTMFTAGELRRNPNPSYMPSWIGRAASRCAPRPGTPAGKQSEREAARPIVKDAFW